MTAAKKPITPKAKKNTPAKKKADKLVNEKTETDIKTAEEINEDKASETPQSASTVIGSLADKMLNLTQIGAKKIENYAVKSAKENDNKNALKLAAAMNRFSQKLENSQEQYVDDVKRNAEELIEIGKQTFGSMKKIYKEMKTRAKTAKQKAEQDVEIADNKDNK